MDQNLKVIQINMQ